MFLAMEYEVTIGIPVYNVEKYVRATLDSVLAQTFPSIEFIFCDDCGTDSSISIIEEYQRSHPRGKDIRIVRQPHNKGLGEARNRILPEVRSKYVYFMDSDDIIAPNTIELLYNAAEEHDAELVYGSMRKVFTYDNNCVLDMSYPYKVFTQPDEFATYVYRQYEGMLATTCNILFRMDVYRNNDLHYQPINYWEDFSFTFDLPTYVTRVVLLPTVTYDYLCRTESLSNYQTRQHIAKAEVLQNITTINRVCQKSDRIKDKPYYPKRNYKLMMTYFFLACNIIQKKSAITPGFTNREIRDLFQSPVSLGEVLRFKTWRGKTLFLYALGKLPSCVTVALVTAIGRRKGLI